MGEVGEGMQPHWRATTMKSMPRGGVVPQEGAYDGNLADFTDEADEVAFGADAAPFENMAHGGVESGIGDHADDVVVVDMDVPRPTPVPDGPAPTLRREPEPSRPHYAYAHDEEGVVRGAPRLRERTAPTRRIDRPAVGAGFLATASRFVQRRKDELGQMIAGYGGGQSDGTDDPGERVSLPIVQLEDKPPDRIGSIEEPRWHERSQALREQAIVLGKGFVNPLERTTQVDFDPMGRIVDDRIRRTFGERWSRVVEHVVQEPEYRRGAPPNKIAKTLDRHHRKISGQLEAWRDHVQDEVLHELLQSTTRTETFKALVDYAGLEEGVDCYKLEDKVDTSDADPDAFGFYVTTSGLEKLERQADTNGRLNLVNIGDVLEASLADDDSDAQIAALQERKRRAGDVLFFLSASDEKLSETHPAFEGGMVLGCFWRGPDNDKRVGRPVDHSWEVEGRHVTSKLMNVVRREFDEGVRAACGVVDPIYVSPTRVVKFTDTVMDAALTIGMAEAIHTTAEEVGREAERLQRADAAAEQLRVQVLARLVEKMGGLSPLSGSERAAVLDVGSEESAPAATGDQPRNGSAF